MSIARLLAVFAFVEATTCLIVTPALRGASPHGYCSPPDATQLTCQPRMLLDSSPEASAISPYIQGMGPFALFGAWKFVTQTFFMGEEKGKEASWQAWLVFFTLFGGLSSAIIYRQVNPIIVQPKDVAVMLSQASLLLDAAADSTSFL